MIWIAVVSIILFVLLCVIIFLIFKRNKKLKSELTIVIVTNQPRDKRLQLLKYTILNSNFYRNDINVLKTPKKFSWNERLIAWKKFYKSLPPDQLVMSLDAFDIILLGNKNEIVDKFKSFKCELLFGWANYCWPVKCSICKKYKGKKKFINPHLKSRCFLCAGAYIGKAGYLAEILEKNPWTENVDDQCYFSTIYEKDSSNKIQLDFKNLIFQNTTPHYWNNGVLIKSTETSQRLLNTQLKTEPHVFHFDSYHYTAQQLKFCYDLITRTR